MKSIRQLLRQPMKTLSGVLLIAAAVAVLCVCFGQSIAASNMLASLEESYTTVALPTAKYQTLHLPEDVADWIDQTVEENPELILADSQAGLASAYIPEMHPDNYTDYISISSGGGNTFHSAYAAEPYGTPYTCVMLEVTLEKIEEPQPYTFADGTEGIKVRIWGLIDRVVGLEQGYSDPTGFTAIMTLLLRDEAELDALDLTIGKRYLTYGVDYYDRDYLLRASIAVNSYLKMHSENNGGEAGLADFGDKIYVIDKFDPENMSLLKIKGEPVDNRFGWDLDGNQVMTHDYALYQYEHVFADGTKESYSYVITKLNMETRYQKVAFTIQDYSKTGGEEKDKTPTIAPLDGTVEEFLASEEAALWQEALNNLEITNQSFSIIGVDNLNYIADFAKQDAQIIEGRDFTDEELANGAEVCIISEHLAQLNGLSVGDTITPRFYNYDYENPYQAYVSQDKGIVNPSAYFYTSNTPFAREAESFTIIGLYQQKVIWGPVSENLYAFSPNTIFAPKTSIHSDMDTTNQGFFRTLVLRNGGAEEFQKLLEAEGQDGLFLCYDQGYTELSRNLHDYTAISQQALKVGVAVYAAILLLYFVLFPTRQGATLATMSSMGADRRERMRHMLESSFGILIPGTVLGTVLGVMMRKQVVNSLTRSADVVLPLEMDVSMLLLISAAQFLVAGGMTLLVCLPLTRNRSLMKKEGGLRFAVKQLRQMPMNTWVIIGFALIVSAVLCGLQRANEAELANYEKNRQEAEVTVTVMDIQGISAEVTISGYVTDLMYSDYAWSLSKYLTDVQIETSEPIQRINGEGSGLSLHGIGSIKCAPELLPVTNSYINWNQGYDESVFGTDEMVCIVPDGYTADADPATQAQELDLYFTNTVKVADLKTGEEYYRTYEHECRLTVVGTYVSTQSEDSIYCPYRVIETVQDRIASLAKLRSFSATLKNNDDLDTFRKRAYSFFAEPGGEIKMAGLFDYSLRIDDEALIKLDTVLNNSITINRISTLLVFILSAGAGFFLGFLMVRQRKREIILMRTLGKPNSHIYRDFAMEQMLCILGGTVIGGAIFLWQPVPRLLLFVAVYFAGLSAALIMFLRSTLLTTIKEDE